jgi:methylated-DNA-[protein]-cysteine S-methyltransferase
MRYSCEFETALGSMTAAAEDELLVGLWFNGQKHFPTGSSQWRVQPEHQLFQRLRLQLDRYFRGEKLAQELRLAPQGTPFQLAVWELLVRIPYGETVSYGDLAREIAGGRGVRTMSAQAVGGAVGRNPLTILIPCHRVVGCDGGLTGYAGGIERKEALLRLERINATSAPGLPGPSEPRRR